MPAGQPEQQPSNDAIAAQLEETANLLEAQGANQFRVRAYRRGAETIRGLRRPVHDLLDEDGLAGLDRLPNIGRSLARAISSLERRGKLPLLERLRGTSEPGRIFATVADIGPKLAERIHEQLGIETLADLQVAANDGRLAKVPGMGPKRLRAVRESLAGRFGRRLFEPPVEESTSEKQRDEPPISELLDIDRQYRGSAKADRLPRVAPRRFNPTAAAWLPIMHTQVGERHYTALFSNTAKAHELGTTHDWVVIYRDDPGGDGQWTVITSGYGKLRGKRIVRGRELECSEYYANHPPEDRQLKLPV